MSGIKIVPHNGKGVDAIVVDVVMNSGEKKERVYSPSKIC